jgi:hypothetical protein
MSGSDWKHYLNGGTSQYNFSYKNNTVAPMPAPTTTTALAPTLVPTPAPMQPQPVTGINNKIPPKSNKKNQTGGRRKRRGHLKRKTMKRKSF